MAEEGRYFRHIAILIASKRSRFLWEIIRNFEPKNSLRCHFRACVGLVISVAFSTFFGLLRWFRGCVGFVIVWLRLTLLSGSVVFGGFARRRIFWGAWCCVPKILS